MAIILDGTNGINSSGVIVAPDGTSSAPSITNDGDTNTGIYFPGADRIGFAEGGTQVGEFDASGNFQFNSGYGSVATAYGCRAWVNFNGTGTVAIRASGNVSSITDNGTGNWTVNFTTAMPDANYSVSGTASTLGSTSSYTHVVTTGDSGGIYGSFSTTAVRLNVWGANYSALGDPNYVMACIFR